MKNNKKIAIIVIGIFISLITAIIFSTKSVKKVDNIAQITDIETLMAIEYGELSADENKTESEYVEFSAFFTKNIDEDEYAERVRGTCKEIGAEDTLYLELNVLTQGYLKNGKITLNADNNFTWTTAIVDDNSIVDGDYIGETATIKLKDEVQNGSQKLFWGTISDKIGNNINNYSKVNSVILTGTYVDEDGNETPINKTVNVTVDWYGETTTEVNKHYYNEVNYTSYASQNYDIANLIRDDKAVVSFKVAVSEIAKELLLQKQMLEIEIPELNGYAATQVKVTDKNVSYEYNAETRILTITRETQTDETGEVTNELARSNVNTVEVTYPIEAYTTMNANSISLNIPIVGYNYGYNNSKEEFENPYISTDKNVITVVYSKPSGDIWNVYTRVGEYVYSKNGSKYLVSKESITDIYNGNIYEDVVDTYPVEWEVIIGDYTAIKTLTLEEQKDSKNNNISDKFLNSSNEYISMYDYIKTTGVYFNNATWMLGEDGWIKLYNGETGSLIETFTAKTWENYSEENPYKVDLKSIKIETSAPKDNIVFSVYQIKEIDDDLVAGKFTQEEFEELAYVYTYLKGTIQAPEGIEYDNGTSEAEINQSAVANYEMPYSIQKLTIEPSGVTNQRTENVDFIIETTAASGFERKWINGTFIIELPEEIINLNINSVVSSNDKVEISTYETYEENGKQYIKIYTNNEEEQLFKITVNAEIAANPLEETKTKDVKLYGYNENCDNYSSKANDIYDLDSDGKATDKIGYTTAKISLVAPSGLLTAEYVTNYDDLGSITIAPNVADIEKSDETRTATINVSVTNNYSGTISDTIILGKTPFEGNTYVINGGSLNSQFTANMTGAITVPEDLKEYVTVYYSTEENPTKDVQDSINGWKKADTITDWSEIRTYLIDFGEYKLTQKENRVFTYEVEVPAGLGYNSASYSDHAVYYNLDTENGKLETRTEPNKVGIQVVSKYNLELTKNKTAYDNMFVKGATYKVATTDADGNIITKSVATNENGVLRFSGLYIDREYTLEEVSAPKDYAVSDEKIKFKAIIEDGKLVFNVLEGEFKETPEVTADENGNYLVKTKVEDEAKFTLVINKEDENEKALEKVKFLINGKNKNNKTYKTDENGTITITGLYPNEEYKLQETKADGYYVDQEAKTFKIVRNADGKLEIQTEDETLKNVTIVEEEGTAQATVTANIKNEKIPTYKLQILKVEENFDEENIENLKPLEGASFLLKNTDTDDQKEYTTDENGMIEISELYPYVEGKYITGEYILQETKAPNGYANNAEEINFKVIKNADDSLSLEIQNQADLTTYKTSVIEGTTVKIVIQDKPLFTLTKIDSETGKILANAKFIIFEIGENGREIDYAKDVNGNYVGEKDENGEYTVTTDENGVIILPLRGGIYKAVEVGYPDGYQEKDTEEIFKVDDGSEEEEKEEPVEEPVEETEVIEIYSIEDLVELSNNVNAGNTYAGKTVKLMNDLDFKNPNSYENAEDTSFGDLNGDGNPKDIMTELTDEEGCGFTPIGMSSTKCFSGIFDGQGYEIRNLYVNISSDENIYTALFGYVIFGEIKNLGITGEIISSSSTKSYAGGIAGYVDSSSISNCYNTGNISSNSNGNSNNDDSYAGGIAGYVDSSSISNCYNTGDISSNSSDGSSYAGGIAACDKYRSSISNCYNTGDISSNSGGHYSYAGGIAGYVYDSSISNCYNTGDISSNSNSGGDSSYVGGIAGYVPSSSISNCYNTGDISGYSSSYSYAGGIAGSVWVSSISNCYNTGDISSNSGGDSSYAGGIAGYDEDSSSISNCYNTGDISGYSYSYSSSYSYAGGIAGCVYRSSISNCYNTGNISSDSSVDNSRSYAGGIVAYDEYSSSISNCYYSDIITIEGRKIKNLGTEKNDYYMQSREFYNELNVDGVWGYRSNNYPVLVKEISADVVASTEITIENTIKKFEITTEVEGDIGGTIDGEDEAPYEIVIINNANTQSIYMDPDDGYGISNITVNGKKIDYIVEDDGTYTIPVGYFQEIQEDKHIIVTYTPLDQILTIKKVDENDNTKLLEGAKFKIEQVVESNETTEAYSCEETTNEYGEIRIDVPAGTYTITEIQAPEGYVLDSEPKTVEVGPNKENSITIKNKQQTQLTVHHYLKESDGTYTTQKVADDEVYTGDIGEDYSTQPRVDLDGVTLQKVDEKYVIPTNATGKYTEDAIEVIYYYEVKPIELKINHYLEGTTDKLKEEKTEEFDSTIKFNADGTYEVTTKGSYEVNRNEEYKDLLNDYVLTRIESSVVAELDINDTLEFTENAELTYYYTLKDHVITTEVKAHEELRTNQVTNEKEATDVDGGTITGQYTGSYKEENGIQFVESVEQKEDSRVEIVADPDPNYTVKQITLVSTNDDGAKTENVIYGEGAIQNPEITYTVDEEGNVTLTTFKSVTEDKHVIVEFEPGQGTVIVHHYIEGTEEKVPSKEEGKVVEDEIKYDFVGERYASKQSEDVATIYELVSISGKTNGEFVDGVIHVYYYYALKDYKYEIHYFYDGIEDTSKAELEIPAVEYGTVITEYLDKPDGYKFIKVDPTNPDDLTKTNLTVTDDESTNVINVYYGTPYKITTDVIEHTEEYKDGSIKENVKGGEISGEDQTPYETVAKGEQPENTIKITPDVGYEIVKVIVKDNKDTEEGITVDLSEIAKATDGSIVLPTTYIADAEQGMQSDKHVEVEFRKTSKVIVKHLEEGTGVELAETEKIIGYESSEFDTARKVIQYYMTSDLGITDEDNSAIEKYSRVTTDEETYVDGTMYADTLTIIYWYERIPAGIIVKHIEINEQDKKDGLTLESGIVLDEELLDGFVSLKENTFRNTYENYISVEGPQSTDENIIIVSKDANVQEATYKEEATVEVRYYYEKQHKVTTEVKTHKEVIDEVETDVTGGTISGDGLETYEIINHRGFNSEEIEITPDAEYRVKEITINNETFTRENFEEDANHKIVLKSGKTNEEEAYFKDVQEDKHVVVEFERIPAKVIVEYRDVDTEEIIPGTEENPIEKLVGDSYETKEKDIENYIFVEEKYPENSTGTITEETITVTYWYTKQFKVTTDVIEHTEVDDDGNITKEKCGKITAEDEDPYELVERGNPNTLDIEIEPFSGYRIKEIQINGNVIDYMSDENIVKEGTIVIIPGGYFQDMQEDKHITVEYERIPAKVKVQHLEEGTEKVLYTTIDGNEYEEIDGFVNKEYKTSSRDIEYYELVEEKYPENSTGIMTEDEIIVKYYYKKLPFNMKVEKEIDKITVNGEETTYSGDNKFAKVEIKYKDINNTSVEVSYKIKVTNTEKVKGTAILEELIPDGFEFANDKSDEKWKEQNGKIVLETEEIKPGETKEYTITLSWKADENNKGEKANTVKITDTENKARYEETTRDDNKDTAIIEIKLQKTIFDISKNNVKTGDLIIFSIAAILIAGVALIVVIKKEK